MTGEPAREGANERVKCGVEGIDEYVLRGGFERGCVVGVTGDLGGGNAGEGGRGGGCAVGRLVSLVWVSSFLRF